MKVWVVSYDNEAVVAFARKPTKNHLQKYFGINPKEFEFGASPLDDMSIESVQVVKNKK